MTRARPSRTGWARRAPEISTRIRNCDYGLLLLSPDYFISGFVLKNELPFFVGPERTKGALPVALRRVPPDGSRYLHGTEQTWIFPYNESLDAKSYSQLSRSADRERFASQLATQMSLRIRRDQDGRP